MISHDLSIKHVATMFKRSIYKGAIAAIAMGIHGPTRLQLSPSGPGCSGRGVPILTSGFYNFSGPQVSMEWFKGNFTGNHRFYH